MVPVLRNILICGLVLLMAGCRDPIVPEVLDLLQAAKSTIEEAKKRGADTYAPELLGLAESELIISEKELKTQESKVFWRQDFSLALRLAHLAQTDAEKALSMSEKRQHVGKPTSLPSSFIRDSLQETLM